jgi:NAD(P)-dependent dehydrogenase (short-subunit alcohol dehydrogenase family)
MNDLFSIAGKTAVVTGGSRGIGLMIARGFVEAGAKVYISSRKAEVCDEVAAELSKVGECISVPADCSTEAGCQVTESMWDRRPAWVRPVLARVVGPRDRLRQNQTNIAATLRRLKQRAEAAS